MLNSLTGELDDFAPAGDTVMWYTCGPTVYDWCHMGHARSFMTFDILRRILEDYFGFKTLVQINITDIDDKIIKRARRNKLIDDYSAENTKVEGAEVTKKVLADMENAITESKANLDAKADKLQIPLPPTAQKREHDLRADEVKAVAHKKENNKKAASRVAIVKDAFEKGTEAVVTACVDEAFKLLAARVAEAKADFAPPMAGKTAKDLVASLSSALDSMSALINEDKLTSALTNTMHILKGDYDLLNTILTKGFVVAMIQSGAEELGDVLDKEKGASITDHSVFDKLAKKFERAYMEDCKTLGIKEPDVLTRVTEYVQEIVDFVDVIVKKDFAYASNGSVYIDLEKFKKEGHSYRKLSPAKVKFDQRSRLYHPDLLYLVHPLNALPIIRKHRRNLLSASGVN
jgi:cysteinyl-tRNA synthetase